MPNPSSRYSLRGVVAFAVMLAMALAALLAFPHYALAYSTTKSDDSVGSVSCPSGNYPRIYYSSSVSDLMSAFDDMVSTTNNKMQETKVQIDLFCDWNTKAYGQIEIPSNIELTLNLHGHMINRDKALSYGDQWYAEGKGDVITLKKGAKLYLHGSSNLDEASYVHKGKDVDNGLFWDYDESGSVSITGGLITGGATDSSTSAGGITLGSDSCEVYIYDTTIAGNLSDKYGTQNGCGGGIGIYGSKSKLELVRSHVVKNHAEGYGGGIYVVEDSTAKLAILDNSEVSSNWATSGGGIYYKASQTLNIKNSKVNDNVAQDKGGGIYLYTYKGVFTMEGAEGSDVSTELCGNKAGGAGGGIYSGSSKQEFSFSNVTISKNESGTSSSDSIGGAAICALSANDTVKLSNCVVASNISHAGSAPVYVSNEGCTLTVKQCSFTSNSSASRGGAVCVGGSGTKASIEDSSFTKNSAPRGGGLYVVNEGTVTLTNSGISTNTAKRGGGVCLESNVCLELTATNIESNSAADTLTGESASTSNSGCGEGCGGGLYNMGSNVIVRLEGGSSICSNTASCEVQYARGGGVYTDSPDSDTPTSELTITSSDGTGSIVGNSVAAQENGKGGGIFYKGKLALCNVSVTGNACGTGGGGDGGGLYSGNTPDDSVATEQQMFYQTVVIDGNTKGVGGSVENNFNLGRGQWVNSGSSQGYLSANSRIGVTAVASFEQEGTRRRVTATTDAISEIGDAYAEVFSSDDPAWTIIRENGYVYLAKRSVHTITFDAGEGAFDDGETTKTAQTSETGTLSELPEPAREGYDFAGWLLSDGTMATATTVFDEDATLTASWTEKKTDPEPDPDPDPRPEPQPTYYEVTLCWPDGTVIATQQVKEGGTATKPETDPGRTGYVFTGWFADESCDTAYDWNTQVNATSTIYAGWKKIHTVSFDMNGGTGSIASQEVVDGSYASRPESEPTREGYDFAGWQLDGKEFDFAATPVSSDITLAAAWTAKTCTVTFVSNGGSTVKSVTAAYGSAITAPTNPTYEKHVFKGWCTDEALGDFYDFSTPVTSNLTLWAKWNETITVTFDVAGGEEVDSLELEAGEPIGPLPSTRRGRPDTPGAPSDEDEYKFEGWYVGDVKVTANSKFDQNTTLTAKWTKQTTPTPDPDPDPEPEPDPKPTPDPDPDPDPEPQPDPDPDPDPKPDADPDADPEPDTDPEPDSGSDEDTKPKSDKQSESHETPALPATGDNKSAAIAIAMAGILAIAISLAEIK